MYTFPTYKMFSQERAFAPSSKLHFFFYLSCESEKAFFHELLVSREWWTRNTLIWGLQTLQPRTCKEIHLLLDTSCKGNQVCETHVLWKNDPSYIIFLQEKLLHYKLYSGHFIMAALGNAAVRKTVSPLYSSMTILVYDTHEIKDELRMPKKFEIEPRFIACIYVHIYIYIIQLFSLIFLIFKILPFNIHQIPHISIHFSDHWTVSK